jgi:hypothetical protein
VTTPDDRGTAWMASVHESDWHAVPVSAGGLQIRAECGHPLFAPVHRRLGRRPPSGDGRVVCAACLQAIEYATAATIRYPWLEAAYQADPDARRAA